MIMTMMNSFQMNLEMTKMTHYNDEEDSDENDDNDNDYDNDNNDYDLNPDESRHNYEDP